MMICMVTQALFLLTELIGLYAAVRSKETFKEFFDESLYQYFRDLACEIYSIYYCYYRITHPKFHSHAYKFDAATDDKLKPYEKYYYDLMPILGCV